MASEICHKKILQEEERWNMYSRILISSIGALLVAVLSTAGAEQGLDHALPQEEVTILKDSYFMKQRRTKALYDRFSGHPRNRDKSNTGNGGRGGIGAKGQMSLSGHLSHEIPVHPRHRKPSRLSHQTCHRKNKKLRRRNKKQQRREKKLRRKKKQCPKLPKALQGLKRRLPGGGKPSTSAKSKLQESKVPLVSFFYYNDDDRSTERNRNVLDRGLNSRTEDENGCVDSGSGHAYGTEKADGRSDGADKDIFYDWSSWTLPFW